MGSQSYNLSLLAFCLFVKSRRANSVLCGHQKAYIACKQYGLNVQTYCKYIRALKTLNLADTDNAGNIHIASIPKLLKALIPGLNDDQSFSAFRYCRFFTAMPKQSSVKAYKDQIERAILKLNADQQSYHISSKKQIHELCSGSSNVARTRYKRLLRQYGATDLPTLSRTLQTLKDCVTTGKNHLSNLLGCSPSTATKRLRKWDYEGTVSRRVNRIFIQCGVSSHATSVLKESYYYACPNPQRTGYWVVLGSELIAFGN